MRHLPNDVVHDERYFPAMQTSGQAPGPPHGAGEHAGPRRITGGRVALWLGLGCLSMIVAALGFAVVVFGVATGALRSSDAYQGALGLAKHDSRVVAALGAPIEPGWFTSGNIHVGLGSGHASLAIPISGPRASGTIRVEADKGGGKWSYRALNVLVAGASAPIDLLPTPAAAAPP